MPDNMAFSRMTPSVDPPTVESNELLRRSVEPPELWLVRLFGALVLHLVLLFGVRSVWVKISVPEKLEPGAIEFVEVDTVAAEAPDVVVSKAEGVAPVQTLKPAAPAATTPDQTEVVTSPPTKLPAPTPSEPEPIAPTQPIAPPKPDQPVKPPKPDQPIKPPKPDQPVKPPKPDQPVKPPKPDQPVKPPKPDQPIKPPKPDQPTKPIQLPQPPLTKDGRPPTDISQAPTEPITEQPNIGLANVTGIKTQLSAEFQRANQINGSLQVTASSKLKLVPTELRRLPPGTVLQLQVALVMENATPKLVPGSVIIRASNAKGIPIAIQQELVEELLADAVYDLKLVGDFVKKPVVSDWDADVEITIN
jgi:hypothetical protein